MKNLIRSIRENYKLVIGVLLAGLLMGWIIFHPSKDDIQSELPVEMDREHDHSGQDAPIWTCSMHPQIKLDHPGKCPICAMDLIPLKTMQGEGDEVDADEIVLTESAAKLADIQTVKVTRGTPQKTLYLQGKVHADERNIAELTARFGGRIEKLYVNFTGQNVQKGEKMATIYSPDLVTAQKELLEAAAYKESRPSFYAAAEAKLKLWDLTDGQITAIEENGEPQLYFEVLSPISGTVMVRHVALGDYVKEGSALFQVTDLKHVWVMFDAYESDIPWIERGDRVEISISSIPGKRFEGKVAYIDPFIDEKSRTASVRIELPNEGFQLKPGMFASGVLHSRMAGSTNDLLIPRSSILWTGKRAVAYVKVPDRESPSFLYREITLGPEAGNFYLVEDGLNEGEEIAVNGVFKIDAASQLEGKPSMMNPDGGKVSMAHDHGSTATADETRQAGESVHPGHQSVETLQQASETDAKFKEQLQSVYDAYILMTDAFVASDVEEVSKNALKVKSGLQKVDMGLLRGDRHMEWMAQTRKLSEDIKRIADSKDIADQRLLFASFNDIFYHSLKSFGLHQGTTYYQYCPMANGEGGAYWFSNEKEIANPYFGHSMLRCGETKETLEF